jgi:tRNA A37 N6-isopentenylltransferase MiaA
MLPQYQYRERYVGPKAVPAQMVAEELERIGTTGPINPSRIIEAARPDGAPLHPMFEWDDKAAAHEYRLNQARRLARAIVVVRVKGEEPRSLFVHVPPAKEEGQREGKYVTLTTVADDEAEYQRALEQALRYMESGERLLTEVREAAEGRGKVEALAIAIQGFAAVREAIALLR